MENEIPNGGQSAAAFDLGALDTVAACNKPAEIELTHPTTKRPLGIFISVVGKDSDVFNETVEVNSDNERTRAFQAQRKNRVPEPKYLREQKAESVGILVACTVGWRTASKVASATSPATEGGDFILLHGEKLSFNATNATRLYKSLPWVFAQIDAAIVDYENFIKA